MIAGVLEIQIMAGLARISEDMRKAERIVGDSMAKVEKSARSARTAMESLTAGFGVMVALQQIKQMSDSYTKLDAQLRLSTKNQREYNQALADVQRISTVAQTNIGATSMLYTRMLNVTRGMNIEQSKIATVAETVSYGLKAYGATAAEASSASLQLSQAMGANRLGGEEFRAVMEAMPNVMRVLADSMGVPLGQLRQLSIDGKITTEVMLKAFSNPEIAAAMRRAAEQTRTIGGELVVMGNNVMQFVGALMKISGAQGGAIGLIASMSDALKLAVTYVAQITSLLITLAAVYAGKFAAGLVQARMATMAMNAAQVEATAINVAQEKASLGAVKASYARTNATIAATVAETRLAFATVAATEADAAATVAQLNHARASGLLSGNLYIVRTVEAELVVATNALNAATAQRALLVTRLTTLEEAQVLSKAQLAASTASLAAAEALHAKATLTWMGKLRAFAVANKTGLIGLALWGAYTIADHLGWLDQVFGSATKRVAAFKTEMDGMKYDEMFFERQRLISLMAKEETSWFRNGENVGQYKQQIGMLTIAMSRLKKEQAVEVAAAAGEPGGGSDQLFVNTRYAEIFDSFNQGKLSVAGFKDAVLDMYDDLASKATGSRKKAANEARKDAEEFAKYQASLLDRVRREREVEAGWMAQTSFGRYESIDKRNAARLRAYEASDTGRVAGTGASAATSAFFMDNGKSFTDNFANSLKKGLEPAFQKLIATLILNTFVLEKSAATDATAKGDWIMAIIALVATQFGNEARKVGSFSELTATRAGATAGSRNEMMQLDAQWFTAQLNWNETTRMSRAELNKYSAAIGDTSQVMAEAGNALGYADTSAKSFNASVSTSGDVIAALTLTIGAQLLPALVMFQREGENLAQTAERLTKTFEATSDLITALGVSSVDAFGGMGLQSAAAREALVAASGGMSEFTSNSKSFIDNFLTNAEKLAPAADAVARTFDRLGIAGVSTNEQFAQLVKEQMALGNTSVVGELLSVAGAFDSLTKSAATANEQINGILAKETFSTMVDWLRASKTGGSAAALINGARAGLGTSIAGEQAGTAAYTAANSAAIAAAMRPVVAEQTDMQWQGVSKFEEALQVVMHAVNAIVDALVSWLSAIFDTLGHWFGVVVDTVTSWLSAIFDTLGHWFGVVVDTLGHWFGVVVDTVTSWLSAIFDTLGHWFDVIDDTLNGIWMWIKPVWDRIVDILTGVWDAVKSLWDIIKGMWDGIVDALKGGTGSVSSWLSGGGGEILPGIGEIFSGLGFARGGSFGAGGTHAFADGSAFTNKIYSSPTPFMFANGDGFSNGVMGEAGDEAVMPLKRDTSGRLGVSLNGGGNGGMIAELRAMRNELAQLRAESRAENNALVGTAQRTERILDKWDHTGMPEVTTV